jgi:uncharacterized membrane protein
MSDTPGIQLLICLHLISLGLWMGGLFGYLVIVWPAIIGEAAGRFPRSLLAVIAMRTAPWIYAAMGCALLTFATAWLSGALLVQRFWIGSYGFLLTTLVGNNVYGTVATWPRMMLLPSVGARQEWLWFRVRMGVSLGIGMALYTAAIYYDLNHR